MSEFQSDHVKILRILILNQKITQHTKKQEGIAHSHDKKQLTETINEETHILELLVTDIKLIILNMLKKLKEIMDKDLKEFRNNM